MNAVNALPEKIRISYIGLLAMVCFRYILKDVNVVNRHIIDRLKPVYENILGGDVPVAVAPGRDFPRLMQQYFAKGSPSCIQMLTVIVSTKILADLKAKKQKALARAGCLISFRRTGLGLINWLEKASEKLEVGFREILRALAFRKWVGSINDAAVFLRDYYDPRRQQITWEWCRLLKDSALSQVSTAACPGLASTLMYMSTDGNDVDNLMQFGNFAQAELERSRLLAR